MGQHALLLSFALGIMHNAACLVHNFYIGKGVVE